jgi:hypothetical protein
MPNPISVLPDGELAVIQYLRARSQVTALVSADRITSALAPQPTYPVVIVKRIGGLANAWQRVDDVALQVEVIGGSRYQCHELARTVRACIMAIFNDTVSEAVLVSASEEVGIQWMPDEVVVPPLPRYVARYGVLIHKN